MSGGNVGHSGLHVMEEGGAAGFYFLGTEGVKSVNPKEVVSGQTVRRFAFISA